MKFKRNDMVLYIPWPKDKSLGEELMYVLGFDAKRNKYKCYDPDIFGDEPRVCFCNEKDMECVPEDSEWRKEGYQATINDDLFDELCYPLFDYDGDDITRLREAEHTYPSIPEWLKGKETRDAKRKERFQNGDTVVFVPYKNDKRLLYVMKFDEEVKKYKCFDPDSLEGEPRVCYCEGDDLEPIAEDPKSKGRQNQVVLPDEEEHEELLYPLYYYDGKKETRLRDPLFTPEGLKQWREIIRNAKKN